MPGLSQYSVVTKKGQRKTTRPAKLKNVGKGGKNRRREEKDGLEGVNAWPLSQSLGTLDKDRKKNNGGGRDGNKMEKIHRMGPSFLNLNPEVDKGKAPPLLF